VLHNPRERVSLIKALALCLLSCALLFPAQNVVCAEMAEVTVDLQGQRHAVDGRIYGQFLEHFGRIIQGGLWAEVLRNRKFYPIDPDRTQVADPWKPEADRSKVSYVIDRFESLDGISSQRVSLFGDVNNWRGISQSGFDVLGGTGYIAYAWIKTDSPGQELAFRLESGDGKYQVQADSTLEGRDWARYEVRLRAPQQLHAAVFRILFKGNGTHWIGAASLMPSDNVQGMRADVLKLIKLMSPTIIRWPGGGYPDDYDWRTGIGPRDRRPPQPILPFGRPYGFDNGTDPNDFGTDEFLDFCKIIGAQPYITANFGSGTPEMAANWVEYTNGSATSVWGKRRADNGHEAPYQVKNWSVGNEIWGDPFESGHTTAEGYAYFLGPIVKAMRAVDADIAVTGVGLLHDGGGQEEDIWNQTVVERNGKDLDFLSIHHYYPAGFHPSAFQGKPQEFDLAVVADPWVFESRINELLAKIDRWEGGSEKLKIALDEWNEWDWDLDLPTDLSKRSLVNQFIDLIGRTGLEVNHTARDALFNARMLQMLMRLSVRVPIGVRTHMINSLGAIRTDTTRSFLTASGVVMELYSNHSGDTLVPVKQTSATFDVPEQGWKQVPYLDAAATARGKKLFLHFVNVHPSEGIDVHIRITGGNVDPKGIVWRISPKDFSSSNDFDKNDVSIERMETNSLHSDMTQHLPPHSITTIEADLN
jgi:alpha-L-arabinofuranosidase